MDYICEHCLANLGPAVEGEPQPHCDVHESGMVRLVENIENADS